MAPVDRREHRQQRVRGAGASTVQASFGFNFGALGAKQSSVPPQRPARRSRTPAQSTPRTVNGSARRPRSLSAPRSVKAQHNGTPKSSHAVTPQLGKRKRASSATTAGAQNEDEDELSPDRVENVRSVEKSRRLAKTVSPIREEPNEAPDELSMLDEVPATARKTPGNTTGPSSTSLGASASSRRGAARRSKSTDVVPVTPGMQPYDSSRHSFVMSTTVENTASNTSQDGDEDVDELSPPHANAITPRVVSRNSIPIDIPGDGEDGGIDELSPPQATASTTITPVTKATPPETARSPITARTANGRPRTALRSTEADALVTPVMRKQRKQGNEKAVIEEEEEEEEAGDGQQDELSPENGQMTQATPQLARRAEKKTQVTDEDSDVYDEETEHEEEVEEPTPRPAAKRASSKQAKPTKASNDKPPRKRQRLSGPKLAISVMRMKGYGVRGITVADTTRTILEEAIDHRLSRMLEKMQTAQDTARRKELRSDLNLVLSFKESLNEKLLDLQDANDVLTTNLRKMKIFKRDNAELRKDILALQNLRYDIALEHDDVQAEFDQEKAKVDAENTLSANMFDLEAAVQNGRKKAKQEGREDEGPNVPLTMLLGTMSRNVGPLGGGLLTSIKSFNSSLERVAGWLEGRA